MRRLNWPSRLRSVLVLVTLAFFQVTALAPGGIAVAVAAGGGVDRQNDHPMDRQMELKARESFAAGRYDEALQLFAKMYAETLHPVYLRNIGRCHQKMREPQKAIDAFHDYLEKAKKLEPAERDEIQRYIREMEALQEAQASALKRQAAGASAVSATGAGTAAGSGTGVAAAAATPVTAAPSAATLPITNLPSAQVGGPADLSLLARAPEPAPAAESPAFYTRWWFWTGVGAVVVAGVATALAMSGGGTTRPPCTAKDGCL